MTSYNLKQKFWYHGIWWERAWKKNARLPEINILLQFQGWDIGTFMFWLPHTNRSYFSSFPTVWNWGKISRVSVCFFRLTSLFLQCEKLPVYRKICSCNLAGTYHVLCFGILTPIFFLCHSNDPRNDSIGIKCPDSPKLLEWGLASLNI